jgi:sugar transferase (PEP-CTERM/EpsH1 system associated)
VRSAEEAREGQGLREYCADYLMERIGPLRAGVYMLARLPTKMPFSMGYFYSPSLAQRIQNELCRNRYDLIFVHCSSVAQYVANIYDVPKILDFGDMDSQKWLEYSRVRKFPWSLVYRLEGVKLEREEKRLARKFNYCSCTTRIEWDTLNDYGVGVKGDWFPNGVDHGCFAPNDEPYDHDLICFIGRMDYFPNQECMFDFCARTLPLLRQRRPQLKLMIVGANPSAKVKQLQEIPGVIVTGSVSDVRPYVRRAALTVAPLNIARGTQNKILESLALGVPVVASRVAAGGIDAIAGEHLLVASTPAEYTGEILRLVENPVERQRFAEAGRARMLSHHDWRASMKRLDKLIGECVKTRTGRDAPLSLGSAAVQNGEVRT